MDKDSNPEQNMTARTKQWDANTSPAPTPALNQGNVRPIRILTSSGVIRPEDVSRLAQCPALDAAIERIRQRQ